ncbi:MAG: hypothetical protein O9272_15495 [Brevundimonas sp.]|nr:hypothetical protein [Brevundimonas sp.]
MLTPYAAPAWAQAPSVLEDMKVVTEDANQASFLLRFSPPEPRLDAAQTEPAAITLLIRNTLRSPQMPGNFNYKGLVRAVEFRSNRYELTARFTTASPARVTIQRADENVVLIKIEKETGGEAVGRNQPGAPNDPVAEANDLGKPILPKENERGEMIFLRYADVSEVIGLLGQGTSIEPNNIFIRRQPGFGSLGSSNQSGFMPNNAQDQRPPVPLGQSFANGLAVNRRLNAIWATGTPERIEWVRQQIAMIDVPVDSVILETQFVELTESGAKNLGIDLNNSSGQIAVGRLETGASLPFNVNPNDVLPSGVLQAAIYAQVEKGEGRILSRPRI